MTTSASDSAGAILTIDLDAIAENWRRLRSRLGGATCAGVVKADAYGLGATRVGPRLAAEGCREFFVAHLDEAASLRPCLPEDARIHVLNGLMPGAEADCAAIGAVPVLNGRDQVDRWRSLAARLGRSLPAAIQLDSGMNRLGLSPREVEDLADDPAALDGIEVTLVMSHLACADEKDNPVNVAQLAAFEAARRRLPAAPASLANSSGIFLGTNFHFDLARPGASLYGVNPTPHAANPMRGVVRLQGRVIQTREVPSGSGVGYGLTFTAPAPARLATVSVGYADGYLRSLSGRGSAWRDGTRLPIVGRVSMDTITIDIGPLPEGAIGPGTLVDLIGPDHDIDAVATDAGTIGYEILTSLGTRYARVYTGGA